MRIGLFTESYDPVINGVSTSVKTLATELRELQHEPVVIAPGFPGFFDEEEERIEVRRLPSWHTAFNHGNPFAYPPVGPTPSALRKISLDVVHTHQPFGIGLHGKRIARKLNVPLVSTFHTLYTEYVHYFPFAPRAVSVAVLERFLRRYHHNCDAVIVPSREVSRRLERIGISKKRLFVVPTGVPDPPTVTPEQVDRIRDKYSLPVGAPVVLYVGRLAKEKNLFLLIDAFAEISRQFPENEKHPILLLVGSGPFQEECELRVEAAGIEQWVRFTGFVRRERLDPFYRASTLFAFPSSTETQGVVLSEAQTHGLPCLVVEGGGASEFVRHGVDALVVPPTLRTFSRSLLDLLNDAELRRKFAVAALKSPLRPTPRDMAQRVVEVYEAAREYMPKNRSRLFLMEKA
ncbi:MAG: glycosyltransferase family 4 protein [Armatimonadaceae bacterium]